MDLLLIIRGLLAVSVIVWHSVGFESQLYSLINLPGRTAVWLFFGISGYVIAYGFIHKRYVISYLDLKDFYINRLLRIYPLFLLISLVSWITELIISDSSSIRINDLPQQLLFLQFNHSYSLNGVFWTPGIEVQFYLVAPLIILLASIKTSVNKLIIPSFIYFISIGLIYFTTHRIGWSFDGRNIISNFPHFIAGIWSCIFVSKMKPNKFLLRKAIFFSFLLLMYTNNLYHHGNYWSIKGILLVDLLVVSLVLAHHNFDYPNRKKVAGFMCLYLLGGLSYGMYAWHSYIMKYFPFLALNIFVLIGLTFIVAFITYRLIEKPIVKLRQ